MAKNYDCIGFGICAADYLCIVPKYPKLDEKTETVEFSYQGGGPVATALVTLARLGFSTGFTGKIGDDRDGRFVLQQFADEGVNTSGIIFDNKMPTNKAFIWIDQDSGKRSIVLNGNNYLPVTENDLFFDFVKSAKYLLIDGRDTDSVFHAIEWAKKNGTQIVLDAGSPRRRMDELLKLVDYPVVSQSFCFKYLNTKNYRDAVQQLLDFGAKAAVVTCGEKGCYGADKTGSYFQPAFQVQVVDTTGAGDVFHGAFIAGLLKNWQLPEILKFSSAVAAIKCTQLGGRNGIPRMEIVNKFLH
ncbi:hypothetical protein H8E88_32260 [candidate division KSB1 bacterium]|nr:hypothetical protein [candidate division KSB1 bacterium]